jgi:hypothetical protein
MAVNNIYSFSQAFSGAIMGLGVSGRPVTSAQESVYAPAAQIALAFATAFDEVWGSSNPDQYQLMAIAIASAGYFSGRAPSGSTEPSAYYEAADAIMATVLEGSSMLGASGITPTPYPPSAGTYALNGARVNASNTPYNASASQTLFVDASAVPIVINIPVLSLYQFVTVQQDQATALSNTITVNGPGGVELGLPSFAGGGFAAAYVIPANPQFVDIGLTWANGGSPGGNYILIG